MQKKAAVAIASSMGVGVGHEGKEKVMIGDYIITGKWVKRASYTVPDAEYWQAKIMVRP